MPEVLKNGFGLAAKIFIGYAKVSYSGTSVGKFLNVRRYSALRCAERGKNILDKDKRLWNLLGAK
jgi:hypothetical protein